MLRVRLDGMAPHLFVRTPTGPHGGVTYQPSAEACAVQQTFLNMFGGGRNVIRSKLPRKAMPKDPEASRAEALHVQMGKESISSLKRKRIVQLESLQQQPYEVLDEARLQALEAETLKTVSERKGPQFNQFLKTIENAAKRKRERAAADPCTYKDKEFRTALSKDASLQEAVQAIRSAPTGVQDVPLEAAGAVVLCNSESCLVRLAGIGRLGLTCSRFLNTVAQYRELLLLPPRKILWYVDASSEENFVVPDRKVATTAFLMASRVLGGYVATEEWAKVCTGAARLLAPPMQLKSFAERKQQWPSCIGHHVSGV